MPSGFIDTPMAVRALDARTDTSGTPVTDLSAEEERMANIFVSEGWISPADSFKVVADTSWNVVIGSGPTDTDYYVVQGDSPGQGNYIVRLDEAAFAVAINPADLSNDRYDEVYLVIQDDPYDSLGLALPRIAVRQGDPAALPVFPGPASAWRAYVLLAVIEVPAGAADITECTISDARFQAQSNVDAPTLQGNAASAFALATHHHDADYASKAHENSSDGHPEVVAGVSHGMMSWQDKAKLNAIASGAEVNLSATEVRDLLKTVDGSASGLDADTLDGTHASGISAVGHNHDTVHYTESEFNALIGVKALKPESAKVWRTSALVIGSGSQVEPLFHVEGPDDWGGFSFPPSKGYINDGKTGYYLVEAQAVFAASGAGTIRQIRLYHNEDGDVAFGRVKPAASEATVVTASTLVYMDGSDYIKMFVYQDSGANLNLNGSEDETFLRLTYLGAAQ